MSKGDDGRVAPRCFALRRCRPLALWPLYRCCTAPAHTSSPFSFLRSAGLSARAIRREWPSMASRRRSRASPLKTSLCRLRERCAECERGFRRQVRKSSGPRLSQALRSRRVFGWRGAFPSPMVRTCAGSASVSIAPLSERAPIVRNAAPSIVSRMVSFCHGRGRYRMKLKRCLPLVVHDAVFPLSSWDTGVAASRADASRGVSVLSARPSS